MKGCDSIKVEAVGDLPTDQLKDEFCRLKYNSQTGCCLGGVSLICHNNSQTDTSSISLTTYNIECTIGFSRHKIEDSTLPNNKFGGVNSLSLPFPSQRSSVELLFNHLEGIIATQLPSMNGVCSYFKYCSQATACIATSFREYGLTALDKLWYLYSYIY